jgi:hypothetical protein
VEQNDSVNGRKRPLDALALLALALQVALAIPLRSIAWTEVTTPAYLCSRGLMLYRDIKFAHTPGFMGILALLFRIFGARTGWLKALPILFGLLAHISVLRETRRLSPAARAAGSAVFLSLFYVWQGNSLWPTALMAAFLLPIGRALSCHRIVRAGLLLGLCVLLKQTAAYALAAAAAALLLRRRPGAAARLLFWGSLPYAAALVLFLGLGSAREFVEWTLLVPFTVLKGTTDSPPSPPQLWGLAVAFLPLLAAAATPPNREEEIPSGWLVVLAAGFALMTFPRFSYLNCLAAVPALALGAGRLADGPVPRWRTAARAIVLAIAISNFAILATGEPFDGRVARWNDDPAFTRLADLLKRDYAGYRLDVRVWGNLLPATGMLPPGNLFVHFWEWYSLPVDSIGERVRAASQKPGTVTVTFWGPGARGVRSGPYALEAHPPLDRRAAHPRSR